MKNKVIFIIGGAGYIGSHMAKYISLKNSYKIIIIDNLSTGHKILAKYGIFEYADIHDSNRLNDLFKKYSPQAVMHFSAFSIVSESMNDPYKYYYNNVSGTLNLLKVMLNNNCFNFIFSSTAAVFGEPEYIPIDENSPKKPINPYGKSKLMVENILKDFNTSYGLKYIIFRYFNAAGHDPDGELYEFHEPETHLLPIIKQTANGIRKSISIFGTDYNTKDGTCIRDYIHVLDLAKAHLLGLEYLIKEGVSNDFNLGNGKGFSVREVINRYKFLSKKDFKVIETKRREGDPAILISSSLKAKNILGWEPDFKNIDEIIKTIL